jgi:hypothetical protein
MMKRLLTLLLFMSMFVFLASPAWAILYLGDGTTQVGFVDYVFESDSLSNYGDKSELDWINETLLDQGWFTSEDDFYTDYDKYDYQPNIYPVYEYDPNLELVPDVYAFELKTAPEVYIVKWGNAGGTYDGISLILNDISLDWGVLDLGDSGGLPNVLNIGAFSHWGEAGGTPVPEPSTILLLGLGLAGIAGIGRKRFKS